MANMFSFLYGQQPNVSSPMQQTPQTPVPRGPVAQQPMNPAQRMVSVMQKMANPFGYLKQQFPDIPDELANDPTGIMRYLQQTRNISDSEVQTTVNQIPWPNGRP